MCVYIKQIITILGSFYETLMYFIIIFILTAATYSIIYSFMRNFTPENEIKNIDFQL